MIKFSISTEEKIEAAESGLKCIEDEIIMNALSANLDPWLLTEDWHKDPDTDDPTLSVLDSFMQRRRLAEAWINNLRNG